MSARVETLQDGRLLRRDRSCVTTGASFGAVMAMLVPPSGLVLGFVGAGAGALVGKLVAPHISADDWEPWSNQRPYVGANSPDDDLAS